MQLHKLKPWERFQIEIGIRWQLFPGKDLTWKQWLFDPVWGITFPGEEITTRTQLPESTSWGVDSKSVEENGEKKKYISLVFWLHGAIRILGLDLGAGIFWRQNSTIVLKGDIL